MSHAKRHRRPITHHSYRPHRFGKADPPPASASASPGDRRLRCIPDTLPRATAHPEREPLKIHRACHLAAIVPAVFLGIFFPGTVFLGTGAHGADPARAQDHIAGEFEKAAAATFERILERKPQFREQLAARFGITRAAAVIAVAGVPVREVLTQLIDDAKSRRISRIPLEFAARVCEAHATKIQRYLDGKKSG